MNLCKVFIFNSLLFFTPTVILAAQSIDIFEPRQYGYVLGDIFERKMILKSPNDTSVLIDEKKIIGRVNNWLSIRKVDINKHAHFSHSIDVQYQVVNVPAKPLMVVVPSLNIKTVSNGVSESIKTTELLVTLAPITPEVVINREGLLNIQPNNQIPQIRTDTLSFRISIWLSLLLIPFLVLFYSWAPWQSFFFKKKLPFSQAYSKIKKLNKSSDSVFWNEALILFHSALDLTAKKTVFVGTLDSFFLEHNEYQKFSKKIVYFLLCSRKIYYENKGLPKKDEMKVLIELVRQMSLVEKKLD